MSSVLRTTERGELLAGKESLVGLSATVVALWLPSLPLRLDRMDRRPRLRHQLTIPAEIWQRCTCSSADDSNGGSRSVSRFCHDYFI